MNGASIIAMMAVAICAISAWLHVKGKDGSGWGMVALILIMVSCSKLQ